MKIYILMAGSGKRFSDSGYLEHKPLIPVTYYKNGKLLPMVLCATLDLPGIESEGLNLNFVIRKVHQLSPSFPSISLMFPKASYTVLEELTNGQATSAKMAIDTSDSEDFIISGCDSGMVLNFDKFVDLKTIADVIVFSFKLNSISDENPNAYGYVELDGHNVKMVSVKKPFPNAATNQTAIVSTFWFRNKNVFFSSYAKMETEVDLVNGEFYIDKLVQHSIELGYKVSSLIIDKYIGWGTPKDLQYYEKTLQYWRNHYLDLKGLV